jgi:hypothetical protein
MLTIKTCCGKLFGKIRLWRIKPGWADYMAIKANFEDAQSFGLTGLARFAPLTGAFSAFEIATMVALGFWLIYNSSMRKRKRGWRLYAKQIRMLSPVRLLLCRSQDPKQH